MCVIVLSGLAALILFEALEATGQNDSSAFRLTRTDDGYSLVRGTPGKDDCVAGFRERVVLVVERSLKDAMGTCRLDARINEHVATILLCIEDGAGEENVTEVVWQSSLP